ncbi:MAG: DUF167 domain-containing protein [Candidatus Saccharibacteria bacterium]
MIIKVRVKPGSTKGPLVQLAADGSLIVYVHEPPQDGKANQAVAKLLANYYGVSKSSIQLISGPTTKLKKFQIDSPKLMKLNIEHRSGV